MSRRQGKVASPKDDWQTPKWLLDALRSELGPIGLDPCTTVDNPTEAMLFMSQGGLDMAWGGPTVIDRGFVFVNPPFSWSGVWATAVLSEASKGTEIVLLLPASVNSRRFHALSAASDAFAFFGRRVSYVDPETGKEMKGADFDSACWYFGHRKFDFARSLKPYATVVVRGHGFIPQEAA